MAETQAAHTKLERVRFAKAEIWMHLAVTAQQWADDIAGHGPTRPFEEWGDDDPLVQIARRYDLTPADLARAITKVAGTTEATAMKLGYALRPD